MKATMTWRCRACDVLVKDYLCVPLTFPYEEADPLNPPQPASDSKLEDVIEIEDTVEHVDETVPASVHEVVRYLLYLRYDSVGRETAMHWSEKKEKTKDKYYGKLILDLGNEVRSSVEEGVAVMEILVRKFGNVEERAECKKLKKELEEARFSNTLLHMQNERVERDLYWTMSHPAKGETRGLTSWISSQHNGVNNRESLNA
ncbi:hypothetical protein Tco_0164629 [Tanacetum coccineum]